MYAWICVGEKTLKLYTIRVNVGSSERAQPMAQSIAFSEIFRLVSFQGFPGIKSRRKGFKKNHKTIGK